MSLFAYNPPVKEAPVPKFPAVSPYSVIGTNNLLIGDIRIDRDVFIGFHNVLRADASPPYYIGPRTNIQDFVLMHCHPGQWIEIDGHKLGVYLEGENSVLHHAAVHGPLYVGRNTFIGQHASIYGATIGRDCVIMHGAVITGNIKIADGRFVAPGQAVYTQEQADALPKVPPKYKGLNPHIVDYYYRLGKAYQRYTPLAH
ncbi:hypothetical protein BSNK01_22720 [Bacillaceae bacterium]